MTTDKSNLSKDLSKKSMSINKSILSKDLYQKIHNLISTSQLHQESQQLFLNKISNDYNISYQTLVSISSHIYLQYTKKQIIQYKDGKIILELYNANKKSIYEIANIINLSPYLTTRLILQLKYKYNKKMISKIMKDTSLIDDIILKKHIDQCILLDEYYSPLYDQLKKSIGLEYEYILCNKLNNYQISYIDEDELKSKGYAKTPDIVLSLPISINNHIVNWIDSKATYGDEQTHNQSLNKQFRGYINRYGPGLVIYWFGYTKIIENFDQNILIINHFPKNITKL